MQPPPDYSQSVVERLEKMVAAGEIQRDQTQFSIARKLDHVLSTLRSRKPATKSSVLGWLFAAGRKTDEPVRPLYPRQRRPRQDHADGYSL